MSYTKGTASINEEVTHPVVVRDDEVAARTEQARAIGLFRYELIREAADPAHSSKARGRLVLEIAAGEHTDPAGRRRRISRDTLDRWIRRGAGAVLTPWSRIRASPRPGLQRPPPYAATIY